ncbi:hypothetical protein WA538_001020, partial [Blastocystis sp. DL]
MKTLSALRSYSIIVAIVGCILSFGFIFERYLTTCMTLCFFLLSEFYELGATFISTNRTPLMTLPDYGFELIPEKDYFDIPYIGKVKVEAVINILLYSLIASCAVLLLTLGDHLLIFRRIILMLGVTALLRPLIFCMTSLPDPCEWGHIKTESEQIRRQYTLVEIINYTFSRLRDPKNVETQGDMLFSGHTRYLFSMVCGFGAAITRENASVYIPLYLVALSVALFTCYLIILCRFHYSVDVFMAILIVVCLWMIISESAELATVDSDYVRLPLLCRWLVSF